MRIEVDPAFLVFAQLGNNRFIIKQEGQDSSDAAKKNIGAKNRRYTQIGKDFAPPALPAPKPRSVILRSAMDA